MKPTKIIEADFEIDKLTNSIENALTGEVFDTEVKRLYLHESNQIKKTDWVFEWHKEFLDPTKEIYKLTTINNPKIIQGLICFQDKQDHLFLPLIENAKFNKGKSKVYKGVAGNLVAFSCKISFEKSYDGVVSFIAKSKLIEHYRLTLGAKQFGSSNRMFIDTKESLALVKQYFKNIDHG